MPTITKIDISLLKENPDNPRTITEAKFQALVESVRQFPQMLEARPIAFFEAPEGKVVIGGNMRLRACKAAGMTEVAAIDLSEYTEAQRREFVIKDNVGFGEWEWDKIVADWPEAPGWGLDIPEWAITKPEAVEDDFEIPDVVETDIVLGDLFEIGEHRLLCGDSTNADDVAKLMDGKKADMVFTDPPYGVDYSGGIQFTKAGVKKGQREKLANDDSEQIYADSIPIMSSITNGPIYTWFAGSKAGTLYKTIESVGDIHALIIWVKNGGYGALNANYKQKHEPCLYWKPKGGKLSFCGSTTETTIWDIDKDGKNKMHPTQKPVALAHKAISNHSVGLVADIFLGSGTTMVAAHQLNRKCYGMELDPKYCQVIVDRMRKLDPAIVIKKNGLTL